MTEAGNHLSNQLLTNQIVDTNCLASSNDKVRLDWVEGDGPDDSGHFLEWPLALTGGELMDGDDGLLVVSRGERGHGGKVVSTPVPTDLCDGLGMLQNPINSLLLLLSSCRLVGPGED